MKRDSLGWLVAGVFAVLILAAGAAGTDSQAGRFQIIQAKDSGDILLDSVTGKSWIMRPMEDGILPPDAVAAGYKPDVCWMLVPIFDGDVRKAP